MVDRTRSSDRVLRLLIAGVAGAVLLSGPLVAPAAAQNRKLVILGSVPGFKFPYFTHMLKLMQADAKRLGNVELVEADGEVSNRKQATDVTDAVARGIDGIVISPNQADALAPALENAVGAKVPVMTVDRSVSSVSGLLGHVGADNAKGGEAQARLILSLFPEGAKIMILQGQPGAASALDRGRGLHTILDGRKDRYPIVFEQTAQFDRVQGMSVTEEALSGMDRPPDVIVAANDDMILGALDVVRARHLERRVVMIGFDALPETLADVKDGSIAATVEQFPGRQSTKALDKLVDYLRTGKAPTPKVELLTPIAITKANLDQSERLDEAESGP